MIRRNRLYEKKEPSRDAQKVYILCEGDDREYNYFLFFQKMSSNLQLVVIPPSDGKSDPVKLMEAAREKFLVEDSKIQLDQLEKDLVWFVIDTDTWQEEGKIAALKDFCSTQNQKCNYSMWNVAQSNPCFETWLYYHIYDERPDDNEVASYPSMKAFVDAKIVGGFNSLVHPVFIEDAIKHSAENYSEDKEGYPEAYATQVFNLGRVIVKYAGTELRIKSRTLR